MRFSFGDLLFAIACSSIGAAPAEAIMSHADMGWRSELAAGIVAGAGVYLILSSFVYRRFRLFPLLLPRCPICRDANRHYFTVARRWPRETVMCAICQATIELCVATDREPEASDRPRFQLLWPYSFGGRWRRLR